MNRSRRLNTIHITSPYITGPVTTECDVKDLILLDLVPKLNHWGFRHLTIRCEPRKETRLTSPWKRANGVTQDEGLGLYRACLE